MNSHPIALLSRLLFAMSLSTLVISIGSVASAADDLWNLDSTSSVARFSIRHLLVSDVNGEFRGLSGTVSYDGKTLDGAKVDATIDVNGINTRIKQRDQHLRSKDVFDVAQFPSISFKSRKIIPGPDGKFQIVGTLSMHGKSKEVTLVAQPLSPIVIDSAGIMHTGTSAGTEINRKDFDIAVDKTIDYGGMLIGDKVGIVLEVGLVKAKPAVVSEDNNEDRTSQ